MYKCLYNFLEVHQILYNLQFGALISLTECIKNTIDNKNFGCGTFIVTLMLLVVFSRALSLVHFFSLFV